MSEREWLEGLRPEDQEVASVEQEDVEVIREALSMDFVYDRAKPLAALDRLAAALERAEWERDGLHEEIDELAIALNEEHGKLFDVKQERDALFNRRRALRKQVRELEAQLEDGRVALRPSEDTSDESCDDLRSH